MDKHVDAKDGILANKDDICRIAEEDLAAVTGGATAVTDPATIAVQQILAYYAKILRG